MRGADATTSGGAVKRAGSVAPQGANRYGSGVPLYEYRCGACGKRSTVLTLRVGETVDPTCKHCGKQALQRLMSRFATPRSEEDRLSALADPDSLGGLDESDPTSMARWM